MYLTVEKGIMSCVLNGILIDLILPLFLWNSVTSILQMRK